MKKLMSLSVLLMISISLTYAQIPVITFEKTEHNFGVIKEEDGFADWTFEFTNTGDAPLIITNVQQSCGCAPPRGWTREPIPPGGTGTIEAGYNPANRPGAFRRGLTVMSNAEANVRIYLSGEVTPRPRAVEGEN